MGSPAPRRMNVRGLLPAAARVQIDRARRFRIRRWISAAGSECPINADSSALDGEQRGNRCSGVLHRARRRNWTSPAIPPILPPGSRGAWSTGVARSQSEQLLHGAAHLAPGGARGRGRVRQSLLPATRRRNSGGAEWRRERRWVVFARDADPTLVPPGWVGWLHRRFEKPPSEQPLPAPRWEKERVPNLTGTPAAYLPPGAIERGGQRATGDRRLRGLAPGVGRVLRPSTAGQRLLDRRQAVR